ncbi:hypothetical protein [Brevibacterium aurantiacum]|uniref:ATPase n=1 Tax=Brevibacterium aurantiacum TaxID=273384 RepID=A0A2A3X1H2_BREAU|nr:hypothetical protein [Brevibacterium aurantiacum]MDN5607720.1 hypothetical protein [Brevibacterium sp.]AZL10163.1 hypothetical protein CXR26_13745 [Brevibacterium aurantiacum]AZT94378.1 hypothetical protein CXR23_15505 [Brevibacterium aurantiacum]MDN6379640.1 hypothetical protein [Brevibacterium aurantiacum]PCC17367.1 hypothetical protein CIK79_03070 [Brevibacterium aurantiacum]
MTTTSPRLVNWENGTDLVIELPLALDVATVWSKLVDAETARTWFASFTVDDDGDDADGASEETNPAITFDLGETQLHGEILSCEVEDHVLIELEDFGVLGIQLLALELTDGDATLLIFTQSAPDVESARLKAADFGPMWDTHLRLFARTLGLDVVEAGEEELLALYADLELEDSEAENGASDASASEDGGANEE